MDAWMGWLLGAAALAIVGVVSSVVDFGMLALAAGAAGGAAAGGLAIPYQLGAFVLVTAGLTAFVRPAVLRRLHTPRHRMGIAALPGQSAVVLERVDAHDGRIKLAGEVWSARSLDAERVFEPGERVDIAEIDGATAVVM